MPGGSVNLTCVAVGAPMPYVKWMKGEQELTKEEEMPIGRNVLELTNIQQSANYTCVAISSLGMIDTTAQITVKDWRLGPETQSEISSITHSWGFPLTQTDTDQYRAKVSDNGFQEVDGVASTRYSIGGLSPYSEYEFRVMAVNNIGRGPPSGTVETRTSEQAPSSPPLRVQARMLSATTMLVQWEPPEEPNGQIRGYRVYYTPDMHFPLSTWQKHNTEDSSLTTISGLVPDITYGLRVLAFTSVGDGPPSDILQVKTQQGVVGLTTTTTKLAWDPPPLPERNGKIIRYVVVYRDINSHQNQTNGTAETQMTIQGLQPDTTYDIRVRARSGNMSVTCSNSFILTSSAEFTKNFGVKAVMKTSVLLTWEVPETYMSQVPFKILYNQQSVEVQGDLKRKLITRLQPDTDYSFVLMSRGNSAGGLQQQVSIRTAPDLFTTKPALYKQDSEEGGKLTITLPKVHNSALVSWFYIVVVPVTTSTLRRWENPEDMDLDELLGSNGDSGVRKRRRRQTQDFLRPYIAAKLENLPETFVLGDEKTYSGFHNKPLPGQQQYRTFILAALKDRDSMFTVSPYSDPMMVKLHSGMSRHVEDPEMLWVMGPVLAVVLIIIIVITILLFKRYYYFTEKYNHSSSTEIAFRPLFLPAGMREHPPVSVCALADHIERLKANDGLRFSQEYESIDPSQQFTWENSNLEVNKPKNRYANVIAYDHSRVVLTPIDGVPGSDYINGNYIDGYRKQNAYIATQGPLPETFSDFWRMVWEQRTSTIVMMTRLEEKSRVKCDQYWPSRGTETYGMIQVSMLDTVELATYSVRTFALYKNGSSEKREVRQFQFMAWPDHGVPEYPTPILAFLRRVKACNPPDAGPMVVHCSAGVGRTGCFIIIEAMLERMKHEKSVDIYGHVTCMRAQRNYMVQTEDQYIFIHEALLEAATCGNTEVPARSLYTHIQKLTQVSPGDTVTAMELEFKKLANSKAHTSRFISASLPCNKFKNRLVNIMPFESSRVCLQPIRGVEGSDYINSSFIDGYRQQKAYIATQGSLSETTEDFWRMLWEHNSTIVVMLTKLREMGREKCHQYWPAERSARYQYFVVDPMAEYNMPQYILREFKVTDARDGQSRTIRQFQFTDWPEQGVPKTGEGFIDFIGQVHKTKEQFGQDGPITVHCSAGVGRTGVFITLSIVLERMRYEGVVDMFQTIKTLRTQRPAMVQTEDQYQLCYRAALEYLGSFDHYAT
uniref:Receptor-type tyrosine-protein phosphatase F n=1 Tax=Sinocyclocheilus rhinocerous TaxID=307959 RepID=A0A673J934_9TELE